MSDLPDNGSYHGDRKWLASEIERAIQERREIREGIQQLRDDAIRMEGRVESLTAQAAQFRRDADRLEQQAHEMRTQLDGLVSRMKGHEGGIGERGGLQLGIGKDPLLKILGILSLLAALLWWWFTGTTPPGTP